MLGSLPGYLRLSVSRVPPSIFRALLLPLAVFPTPHIFERLQAVAEGFPVLTAEREHHIVAARVSNACRRAGVSATTIDCLIAAQTIVARGSLLTLDRDFGRMAPHCGLELFPPHPS